MILKLVDELSHHYFNMKQYLLNELPAGQLEAVL